ncbi:MAG TPA: hypothetical protein VF701_22720 [Thermoanaerobaculia bacterium]
MADTILRLGLWILILVLALFIIADAYHTEAWAELVPAPMLQQLFVLSLALIAAGIVAHILGKGAKAVSKNRCQVCKAPIPHGAMYCRAHLRTILHDEDDRTHGTRPR